MVTMIRRFGFGMVLILCSGSAVAREPAEDDPLQISIQELRDSIGKWNVQTEFLNEDGSVVSTFQGTYEFSWVVEDRVVSGKSEIPALKNASGILFYVDQKEKKIEMVSVGKDGRLWIMTGPLGGNARTTPEFETADGGKSQLRFTRYNVKADSFESKMEITTDGGESWRPGNHQIFRRAETGK